jgi:tetratricopeptide (TPR) repeat protein
MVPTLERLVAERSDAESGLVVNAMLGTWAFFRGNYLDAVRHNAAAVEHYSPDRAKEQHSALLIEHGFEGFLYPALYLAWSQTLMGDVESAQRTWQKAATVGETIGDPYVSVMVFAFGAAMNHDLGDLAAAADLAGRTRELCQEKGFVFWLAIAIIISGSCKLTGSAPEEAIATIQEGLKLLEVIGDRHVSIYYMSYLANAYLKNGRAAEAAEVLEQALGFTRIHVAKFCQPELLRLLGEARLAQGQIEEGRQCLVSALECAHAQGAKLYERRAAATLAALGSTRLGSPEGVTLAR